MEKSKGEKEQHSKERNELDKIIREEHATPSESGNNYSRGSQVSGVAADNQENWSRDQVQGQMTGQEEVLKASERIKNLEEDSNSRNTKMDEESPRGEKVDPDRDQR